MRWAHQHSRPGSERCVSAVCFAVALILLCDLRKYRHTGHIHDHPLMVAGFFFFLIIYLAALGFSCCVWDLVPRPGVELQGRNLRTSPAWQGRQILNHWTTREVH